MTFAFTALISDHGSYNEVNGVVDAIDEDSAILKLNKSGYLVKKIRPARPLDIQMASLRQMKDKLSGKKVFVLETPKKKPISIPAWFVFSVVLFVLIVCYTVLKG